MVLLKCVHVAEVAAFLDKHQIGLTTAFVSTTTRGYALFAWSIERYEDLGVVNG